MSSTADNAKDETIDGSSATHDRAESAEGGDAPEEGPSDDGAQHLVKLSYHDSGIDIRDPVLHVNTANTKKVGFVALEIRSVLVLRSQGELGAVGCTRN